LDLRGVNFSSQNFSSGYANNVLTVTDGTNTANINVAGTYTLANFHFATDGSGGTLVTDPPSNTETVPSSKIPTTLVDSATNPEIVANVAFSAFENGTPVTQKSMNADGSSDIAHFDVSALGYSSYEDMYSGSGARVAEAQDMTDGSGALLLDGEGLTIDSGPGQLSVMTGADTFTLNPHAKVVTTANGHKSEVFSHEAGSGESTITGFDPTGISHDTLHFQTSTFSDAAAVLHNASPGANAAITDAIGDTLTLANVPRPILAANQNDFRFT
jgi:hypothetical protein